MSRAHARYANVIPLKPAPSSTAAIQRKAGNGEKDPSDIHSVAASGVAGANGRLPHAETIQAGFGKHDIANVRTATGGAAADACTAMGAQAFAMGDALAFAVRPDLHTAAHEAAHVVQQRGGVSLKSNVGHAGDRYEQHADAVADLIVQGKSAESLLDQYAGAGGARSAVQRKETDECLGESDTQSADSATADEALQIAESHLNAFGRPMKLSAAPAPWTEAVESIRLAACGEVTGAAERKQHFDQGIAGLASALGAASAERVQTFESGKAYGEAQLSVETALELRTQACEADLVLTDLEQMVTTSDMIYEIATGSGMPTIKPESEWTPISIEVPTKGPIEIPTRDAIGGAISAMKSVFAVWKAGESLKNQDPNEDPLKLMGGAAGGVLTMFGGVLDFTKVVLEQASAFKGSGDAAEGLAEAAKGLGTASKAIGGIGGVITGVASLSANCKALTDASLPVVERADAGVGAITALGSIAGGVVQVAEAGIGANAVAASGVLSGMATFATGCGFLGAGWFIVKAWITEFPKIKGFANGLCEQDANIVREFASGIAKLGDRLVVADELDAAGNDPAMTEAKNNAFSDLQQHVIQFANDLRWFSELRSGVSAAIAGSGMANAESPRDAVACAQALMASLDELFNQIPELIQRELGLSPDEMPPAPDGL